MYYSKQRQVSIKVGRERQVDAIRILKNSKITDLDLKVNVRSTQPEKLSLALIAPDKTKAVLKGSALSGRGKHHTGNFTALKKFKGKKTSGLWQLEFADKSDNESYLGGWTLCFTCNNTKRSSEIFTNTGKTGIKSSHYCHLDETVHSLSSFLSIKHPKVQNLKVVLTSPQGRQVTLQNRLRDKGENLTRKYSKADLKAFKGQKTRGVWTLEVIDGGSSQGGRLEKWALCINESKGKKLSAKPGKSIQQAKGKSKSTTTTRKRKDDLKKIEGIGPKIEKLLNDENVWTFSQLSKTKAKKLKSILKNAGPKFTMHDPGTWPKQAAMAEGGHWEKLRAWQNELSGGKKV